MADSKVVAVLEDGTEFVTEVKSLSEYFAARANHPQYTFGAK